MLEFDAVEHSSPIIFLKRPPSVLLCLGFLFEGELCLPNFLSYFTSQNLELWIQAISLMIAAPLCITVPYPILNLRDLSISVKSESLLIWVQHIIFHNLLVKALYSISVMHSIWYAWMNLLQLMLDWQTDVLGVYDRPPSDPNAVLLREIGKA